MKLPTTYYDIEIEKDENSGRDVLIKESIHEEDIFAVYVGTIPYAGSTEAVLYSEFGDKMILGCECKWEFDTHIGNHHDPVIEKGIFVLKFDPMSSDYLYGKAPDSMFM